MTNMKIIGWQIEFEDGSIELYQAKEFIGEPTFGRWITPLVAGGETVDLSPDSENE